MKKEIGLWIDHRKAVVVIVTDQGNEVQEITRYMEKHAQLSNRVSEASPSDYVGERQLKDHLNSYYDQVIASIKDGNSIHIFGPDETKDELEKRLESSGLGDRIVRIGAADELTDRQIVAKVREYLRRKKAQSV